MACISKSCHGAWNWPIAGHIAWNVQILVSFVFLFFIGRWKKLHPELTIYVNNVGIRHVRWIYRQCGFCFCSRGTFFQFTIENRRRRRKTNHIAQMLAKQRVEQNISFPEPFYCLTSLPTIIINEKWLEYRFSFPRNSVKKGIELCSQNSFPDESLQETFALNTETFASSEKQPMLNLVKTSSQSAERKFLKNFPETSGIHTVLELLREISHFYPVTVLGFTEITRFCQIDRFSEILKSELQRYRQKTRAFISKCENLFNVKAIEEEI